MRIQVQSNLASLDSLSGLRIQVALSSGVGRRHSSDLMLLWLWWLTAAAPIQSLAWEPLYVGGAAFKKKKEKGKTNKQKKPSYILLFRISDSQEASKVTSL